MQQPYLHKIAAAGRPALIGASREKPIQAFFPDFHPASDNNLGGGGGGGGKVGYEANVIKVSAKGAAHFFLVTIILWVCYIYVVHWCKLLNDSTFLRPV